MKKFLFLSLMFSILTFGCYAANDYIVFLIKNRIFTTMLVANGQKSVLRTVFLLRSHKL